MILNINIIARSDKNGIRQLSRPEHIPEKAALPASIAELDVSERLIVWAVRRWVGGLRQNDGTQWALVWKEFSRQFGHQEGTIALAGFLRLIDGLQRNARRAMRLHQACCPYLSADEAGLIGFIAACQSPEFALAKARAEWLAHPDGVRDLLEAGTQLAEIMQRGGMTLPRRATADIESKGENDPQRVLKTVH